MPLIVVYDSSVLYPAPLRDTLMELAKTGLFQAKWSRDIHGEWIDNLLENRPDLMRVQLEYTKQQMELALPDALVTGYKSLIPSLILPDPDDRHVLAIALRSNASMIVTFNLKDFPKAALSQYHIKALHPDDFIMYLVGLNAHKISEALGRQRMRLRRPAKTVAEFLETLEQQGLKKTVVWLRTGGEQIS